MLISQGVPPVWLVKWG